MKNRINLYASIKDAVEALTDEEAGRVLKSVLRYMNGEEPMDMDGGDKILWLMLKQQIDREGNENYRRNLDAQR